MRCTGDQRSTAGRRAAGADPGLGVRIQAIVSDLGQVILPFDVERAWSAVLPHCDLPATEARSVVRAVMQETRFGCGAVTGEEFHNELVRRAGLRLSLEQFRVAWSDMFWVAPEVIDLIRRAPVRYRLLLSNTNELHWSWITETYAEALADFDHLLVSHECGIEKPVPEIYRMATAITGLRPEEHLFIDDIAENVAGARAVGMDAIRHTDAANLRRELAARGLAEPDGKEPPMNTDERG